MTTPEFAALISDARAIIQMANEALACAQLDDFPGFVGWNQSLRTLSNRLAFSAERETLAQMQRATALVVAGKESI